MTSVVSSAMDARRCCVRNVESGLYKAGRRYKRQNLSMEVETIRGWFER